jgi:hypothetical protein
MAVPLMPRQSPRRDFSLKLKRRSRCPFGQSSVQLSSHCSSWRSASDASRREAVFNFAVICLILCLYSINETTWAVEWILPEDVARFHFNDYCAGVLLPAYINLVLFVSSRSCAITTLRRAVATGLLCTLSWEVVAPAFLTWSTPDPVDALAYMAGCLSYLLAHRVYLHVGYDRRD